MQRKIRQVAILVNALDVASADALLENMEPEVAARVRTYVMELDNVDPVEERAVIEQFLGGGDSASASEPALPQLDDALSATATADAVPLADFLNRPAKSDAIEQPPSPEETRANIPANSAPPFGFLETTPHEALLGVLAHEHPQAIAVVLSHVAPQLAADVLQRMPAKVQADVTRRIMHLAPIHEETLRELEKGLEELVGAELLRRNGQGGVAAMQNILSAVPRRRRQAIVARMDERNAALLATKEDMATASLDNSTSVKPLPQAQAACEAREQCPGPTSTWEFEDLLQLTDRDLGRVLQSAGGRLLLLALAGASEDLMARVYGQLPRRDANTLRRQIEQQGPISLRDVEAAQARLAHLAEALAHSGKIQSPRKKRFAAAA